MSKKSKIALTIALVLVLLVLFFPIPRGTYDDGGTREFTALTYKLVIWNRIQLELSEDGEVRDATYRRTSVYLFPDNFKTIDELWALERARVAAE